MKKTMIMSFLIISMVLSLCACGNGVNNAANDTKNMVEDVGKDAANAVEDVGTGAKDIVEDVTGMGNNNSLNNSANSGGTSASSSNNNSSSGYISQEDAKAKAFEHAQIKSADARVESVKLDTTDKTPVYDVEFSAGGYEYNYEIDAKTGEIVKSEKDFDTAK